MDAKVHAPAGARILYLRVWPERRREPEILLVRAPGGEEIPQADGGTYTNVERWQMPGGKYEKIDGTLLAAALREFWEELKRHLNVHHMRVAEYAFSYFSRRSQRTGGLYTEKVMLAIDPAPPLDASQEESSTDEVIEARWFPLSEVPLDGNDVHLSFAQQQMIATLLEQEYKQFQKYKCEKDVAFFIHEIEKRNPNLQN